MPVRVLERRKRQKKLLIIALIVLIAAVVILYFAFWQGEKASLPEQEFPAVSEQEQITELILEQKLKKIDLDFGFLNQTILVFLKSYGDFPVEKGQTGRINPFIPY